MITCLKNQGGYILAYLEWDMIDDDGQMHPGAINRWNLFVKHIWVHEDYNFMECLRLIVHKMSLDKNTNGVRFIEWERLSKDTRVRKYVLHKILKRIFGSVKWETKNNSLVEQQS